MRKHTVVVFKVSKPSIKGSMKRRMWSDMYILVSIARRRTVEPDAGTVTGGIFASIRDN